MNIQDRKKIARQMIRVARTLMAEAPQGRSRKAYGLIRDPQRVIKNMKDKGVVLDYDGSIWTYDMTDFGVPNYSQKPKKYAGDAGKAVRKTKHVMDSLKSQIDKYSELLDAVSKYKRLLNGMQVSEETIDDMLFYFKNDLEEFINNRVQRPELKSINTELNTIKQKVGDGDFKGAIKNCGIIQDILAGDRLEVWRKQYEFYKAQRKQMMEIERMLTKNPEIAMEIATIGTPPSDSGQTAIPTGPTQQLSADQGERRLVTDLQRLIKLHGVAKFKYQKKDGGVREVTVQPTDLKRTSNGPMIVGYDADRQAERNFLLKGIQ